VDELDATLTAIAEEARRLVVGELLLQVQGLGDDATLVVEPVGMAPYTAERLAADLKAFCAREGLMPRLLVLGGTQPQWVPRTPAGWPPAKE
jgi:hypothetical protein